MALKGSIWKGHTSPVHISLAKESHVALSDFRGVVTPGSMCLGTEEDPVLSVGGNHCLPPQ